MDGTTEGKTLAALIQLERVEGPVALMAKGPVDIVGPNPWEGAHRQLQEWALTAPRDGSVDKTDFTVIYEDGQRFSGCFGLTFEDQDLPAYIRQVCDGVLAHPEIFGKEVTAAHTAFLAGYEIGSSR